MKTTRWPCGLWAVVGLALVACGFEEGEEPASAEQLEPLGQVEQEAGNAGERLTGATRWVRQYGGPSSAAPSDVAHDRQGNVIVTVSFATELRQESQGICGDEPTVDNSSGVGSIAVIKYRPDGTQLWSRIFSAVPVPGQSEAFLSASDLAVDRRGNIIFIGWTSGSVHFGGEVISEKDFLVKLDPDGSPLWARPFTRLSSTTAFAPRELATDPDGNIALAASLLGSIDLGGGEIGGDGSALLAKFNPAGDFLWSFVETRFSYGEGVIADSEGRLYLCGTIFTDLFDFDSIPFVQAFSPSGTRLWEKQLGTLLGHAKDVAVHGNRVVVVGEFSAPLTFLGKTYEPSGGHDAFVAAFTRAGDERWVRTFGVSAASVAMDPRDGVVVTGRYEAGDNLGLGRLGGIPGSTANLYVAKFDRIRGVPRWTRGFALEHAESWEYPVVSTDKQGRSAVSGRKTAPIDFGLGALSNALDGFLVTFAP